MSYKVEATVDGIRFLYDGGEIEVDYNASDGDVVRLTIEPLEVNVTDGFRAAVKEACNCDSSSGGGSGGSGGGGMLKVTASASGVDLVLDKNYNEIVAAMADGGAYVYHLNNVYSYSEYVMKAYYDGEFYVVETVNGMIGARTYQYESASATGVLVRAFDD